MNEINDLPGEFTDDFLHAQADAGDYLLEEEGFPEDSALAEEMPRPFAVLDL